MFSALGGGKVSGNLFIMNALLPKEPFRERPQWTFCPFGCFVAPSGEPKAGPGLWEKAVRSSQGRPHFL